MRSSRKALKIYYKLKRKAKDSPTSNDIGIEPVGDEEFQNLEKREYGFDWESRKSLAGED